MKLSEGRFYLLPSETSRGLQWEVKVYVQMRLQ
jgi:hypothetical protein